MKTNPSILTWSSDLAYVVGLLITDGNLSSDGRHIIMRSSDKDLLQTFRNILHRQNIIGESKSNGYAKKPSYRLQFGDVTLYKFLLSLGLFPNKTYTIGEILIPDDYFRDFLRGHLDGDGSVFMYRDKYMKYKEKTYNNLRVYLKFISASEKHIQWLAEKNMLLANVKGSITKNTPKENRVPIWMVRYAKKESIKLIDWMYYDDNLPCLMRKKLLVKEILAAVHNDRRV